MVQSSVRLPLLVTASFGTENGRCAGWATKKKCNFLLKLYMHEDHLYFCIDAYTIRLCREERNRPQRSLPHIYIYTHTYRDIIRHVMTCVYIYIYISPKSGKVGVVCLNMVLIETGAPSHFGGRAVYVATSVRAPRKGDGSKFWEAGNQDLSLFWSFL